MNLYHCMIELRSEARALVFAQACTHWMEYLQAQGLITGDRLWSGLAVLPASLLGAWLGQRIHVRIPEPVFRRLVSGLLGLIGALLLIKHLGAP